MTTQYLENEVQGAIEQSLTTYAALAGSNLLTYAPYANQQGEERKRYCADIVGVIDNAYLILLEVKALNHATKHLHAFDEKQFQGNLKLASLGIPICYAYDSVNPLSHFDLNLTPIKRAEGTLNEVLYAFTPRLPRNPPDMGAHNSLIDIFRPITQGGDISKVLGWVLGASARPGVLRNDVLALILGVESRVLFSLNKDELNELRTLIGHMDGMSPKQRQRASQILSEAKVFEDKPELAQWFASESNNDFQGPRPRRP